MIDVVMMRCDEPLKMSICNNFYSNIKTFLSKPCLNKGFKPPTHSFS